MQTDVRSVHLNQTGFAYVGRTRVRGMVATTTSTGGVIHIFDTTTAPVSASVTYARTGYTVTVTKTGHGLSTGDKVGITFAAGTTAVVLSDGSNLYILTQVGAGSYFANNGSASAPSFSFNNDTTTGMYLNSLYQLGLSANQQPMLLLDATNISDLQVSTPATFNAGLIGGGTF